MIFELFASNEHIIAYKQFNPAFVTHFEQNIEVMETEQELEQYLENNSSVYIISREKYHEEIQQFNLEEVARAKDTFETPITLVLKQKD